MNDQAHVVEKMFENILVLSPHTDDGELGCGGTISKFSGAAQSIKFIAFSYANQKTLKDEMAAAMNVLGIKDFEILDFERRYFHRARQEILDYLIRFSQENIINLVFAPSVADIHQDHEVIAEEAMRAFRSSTILGYEMPWNTLSFKPNCFISLRKKDVEKKLEALQCYKTQKNEVKKHYFKEDFLQGLLRTRGTQIKEKFAEAFEVVRIIA